MDSDRGVQYASNDYINHLKENNINISMSRKENPYDNAFAKKLYQNLEIRGSLFYKEYESFDDAYGNIKEFIEEVYNEKRIHSSISYLTPNESKIKTSNTK